MSWILLKTRTVISTRKAHVCHGCGRKYPVNSYMRYEVGVNEGNLVTTYYCVPCIDFMEGDVFDWEDCPDGMYEGDIWEYDEYKQLNPR